MIFKFSDYTIYQKITILLIIYFFVAFTAITSTLFVSWRLEGGAAAINVAGSQRMHSYQIGFLISRYINKPSETLKQEIDQVSKQFEAKLEILDHGMPSRPLVLPNDPEIRVALSEIKKEWFESIKLRINEILTELNQDKNSQLMAGYSRELQKYVSSIDAFVKIIEESQLQATKLLRRFQIGLVGMALIGTVLLLYIFIHMVIQPIRHIQQGLLQMGKGNFSLRLPILSHDELGDLTVGFNAMAQQLQEIYTTLEQRVKDKTNRIEMKSRELSALYDAAAFLNQATVTETLCDGVLGKMVTLFNAQAGVIRLVDPKGQGIPIIACYGVSEDFLKAEAKLKCGECLCGETVQGVDAISCKIDDVKANFNTQQSCRLEGFEGITSVQIKARNRVIGVFNLFFRKPCILTVSEVKLLETVGQHLGAAIENQQFIEREKEMAVSEERNLLAQELHDSIAQSLAFLNIQVQLLQDGLHKGRIQQVEETLNLLKEGIQESYDDVRELLVHFRTRIEHDDIEIAIQSALQKFEGQTGIKTRYSCEGNAMAIQPERVLQLLHILHECLSNIRKHAKATQVDVHLSLGEKCRLIIRDNGIGFDNLHEMSETHVGLRIMKERAHRIGGTLAIDTSLGSGTEISITLMKTTALVATEIA